MARTTAADQLARMRARVQNVQAQHTAQIGLVFSGVEAAAAGLADGYLQGRYPDKMTVLGQPVDAVLGTILFALGVTEYAGQYSDDLVAIGSSLVACSLYRKGEVAGAVAAANETAGQQG